jgi:GNAT superfamily N-acetyltransferase
MDVRMFDDAGLFAQEAGAYFEADPFSASVIAVHVAGVAAGVRSQAPADMWATVVDDGEVVGVAMHTPPHKLFLARMPSGAAVALAETLARASRQLPGVSGELGSVTSFDEAWRQRTGCSSAVAVSMRMYRLADLVVPAGVLGRARSGGVDDVETVAGCLKAFHAEAQPHAPVEDWTSLAHRRVLAGQFRLWENDGAVVSMAGFSSPAAGVSRVGPVYTPPARRGRGFGSAVTADATAAAIAGGADHVVLYTDLSNPTSNAIYQTIGYRVDHDAEERSFDL